jgi:hypothetical protein
MKQRADDEILSVILENGIRLTPFDGHDPDSQALRGFKM